MKLSLTLLAFVSVAAAAQERRLPLDPLTGAERETAVSVAREHSRVRAFVERGRSRLIYSEFISVKDGQSGEPRGRFADVLFYRYEDDAGLRALVDLEARRVSDVAPVSGRSVPVTAEEVAEAARLALASPVVRRLFGDELQGFEPAARPPTLEELNRPRIGGLRTLGGTPTDPCARHRCVVLFFRTGNRYIHMNQVVVDLTTNEVLTRGAGGAQ